MNPRELREKTIEELQDLLVESKKKLFGLRLRQASGETVDPHEFRVARKDVARVRTTLNQYKMVMDQTGLDEAAARARLAEMKWSAPSVIRAALIDVVVDETGADKELARESLLARGNSRQLAIDAIRIARIVPPGKHDDPKAVFKSFRRLRRDGFHLCGRYRQAAEALLSESTGAEPKLIRMALADSTYNMAKAESIINVTQRVADETGASSIRSLVALETAGWREKLTISRLKARANKMKKKVQA